MCCESPLRKPINFMYDPYRYRAFLVLYAIDLAFFIIRLGLVGNDLSINASGTKNYLIPILIFDLIASVPLIVCNLIYIVMRHCILKLIGADSPNNFCGRLGTMTCIRHDLFLEHPQLILLMRVFLIIAFFLLKFMCFVIGASCSARFKSQCTAYTVFAAFTLANSLLIIVVEFIHYFRLWTYNATDTRNQPEDRKSATVSSEPFIEKPHRCHLRFIHYSMINDRNASGFHRPLCPKFAECQSESLHHQLIYHSLELTRQSTSMLNNADEKKTVVAFYETTKEKILQIVRNGLPFVDNLKLDKDVFFTPSVQSTSGADNGILCARINLGRFKVIKSGPVNLDQYFKGADGTHDTIYVESESKFYLRMPGQVEKWIVMIPQETKVNDQLDSNYYIGCYS